MMVNNLEFHWQKVLNTARKKELKDIFKLFIYLISSADLLIY